MPAPPSSLRPSFWLSAATANRSASAMGSSSGPLNRYAPCARPASRVLYLDHDRLEVGHLLERESAADAPDAALLAGATAERQVRLPVVGRLVDVHPSGFESVREAQRPREVACVDGAKQPIRRIVGEGQRLLLVAELDDRRDRAERLLLAHAH